MPTPSIQTLVTDAQQVLNLDSISAVRSVVAVALANANTGTPLNPNLTTQQLWNEFYQVVNKPKSDIESIIANQLMKLLYAPPAPGGVGANGQVIFNDGGVLAGDPQFLWNKTTNLLTVTGSATITGDLTVDTSTLKVDSANNRVGILTASPRSGFALDVLGSAALGDSTTGGTSKLTLDGIGTAGNVPMIRLRSAGVQKAFFGLSGGFIGDTSTDAFIGTDAAGAAIRFYTSDTGVEVARFNSTGNLAFANTKGIDFSATASGSGTMTSELLNDYEEGTWVPVIADATTGGNTGTCTISSATYTKIGRQVSIQCDLRSIDTTGMTGANNLFIRGLPFASVRGGNGNFYSYRISRNASTVSSSTTVDSGVSHIYLSLYTTSSANTNLSVLVSDIVSGTSELALSVTYFV